MDATVESYRIELAFFFDPCYEKEKSAEVTVSGSGIRLPRFGVFLVVCLCA